MNLKIKFPIVKLFALLLIVLVLYSCSDEIDILESNQPMSKQNTYFQSEDSQNISDIKAMAEQLGFSTERITVEDGVIIVDRATLVSNQPVNERNTDFKKPEYRNSDEYDAILEQLGFSTKNVVVDDEFVMVDGDILFEKNYLDAKAENKAIATTDQVLMENVRDIDVFIDNRFTGGEIFSIAIAALTWEGIPNCAINFNFMNNADNADHINADLAIFRDDFAGLPNLMQNLPQNAPPNPLFFGTHGRAWFANNGNVGRWVSINTDLAIGPGFNQFILNAQHEIGHCLGFAHGNDGPFNNEQFGNGQPGSHSAEVIHCTLDEEVGNLMEGGAASMLNPLSDDEMRAAHIMYPEDLTATKASYTTAPFLTTITLSAIFDNYEVLPSEVHFELLDGANVMYGVQATVTCGRAYIVIGGNTHPTHLRVTAFNRGGDFSTTTTIPVEHINLWNCWFC